MKSRSLLVKPLLLAALTTGTVALIAACGGGSDSNNTTTTLSASSYAGPGSRWDVALAADSTFNITKRESASTPVVMTLTGSYQALPSGFLKLAVGSVTADAGVTNPPVAGDAAYALNVPGYVMILKPIDAGDDQIIPMVAGGTCPTANFDANWIMVKVDPGMDVSRSDSDIFGTFNFDAATGTPSLPSVYALDQTGLVGGSMTAGNCAGGVMVVDNEAEMYLTNNGGAIVRTGLNTPLDATDDNFIFAFARETIGNVSNVAGDYAGLLFDAGQTAGSQISPVSVTCDSAGACTGQMVTDIETNTLSTESVTISLSSNVDVPSAGFITGTIADSAPGSVPGNLACTANVNALGSGKTVMSCAGQSPGDVTKMFNILLVSK